MAELDERCEEHSKPEIKRNTQHTTRSSAYIKDDTQPLLRAVGK